MNKKKIVAVVAVVVALVLLGAAIALAYIKGQEEEPLGENQRYVYAYITGIEGNEVTYTELDESVVTAYLEQQAEAEEGDDASDGESGADADEDAPSGGGMPEGMEMPSDGEMPSGGETPSGGEMPNGGEMPEGMEMPSDGEMPEGMGMPSGGMPSGAPSGDVSDNDMSDSTELPEGMEMPSGELPEGMEMPSGMPDSDTSGESGNSGRGSMGNGETVTTLIPVGVTVHTTSDAKTTFQRLVSGDMIKILMETNADGEEVIIEIWML